jgi:hypothetical protein
MLQSSQVRHLLNLVRPLANERKRANNSATKDNCKKPVKRKRSRNLQGRSTPAVSFVGFTSTTIDNSCKCLYSLAETVGIKLEN